MRIESWHLVRLYSLVELPLSVVKGTHLSGLEPPGDAVKVEGMVAHTPSHCALFAGGRRLVGLTLDTCSANYISLTSHCQGYKDVIKVILCYITRSVRGRRDIKTHKYSMRKSSCFMQYTANSSSLPVYFIKNTP